MPFEEVAPIVGWTLYLWLAGWAAFPVASRLFPALPDAGLAAGRLGLMLLATLLCFWGASVHVLPLTVAPVWFWGLPLVAAAGWRHTEVRERARMIRGALVWSDAVFLLAWAFFLWVRLRHPGASDLEKPMDLALMAAARRADFLPFENPWFAGQPFTNYYYFGPLMGAMLARSLGTVPWYAYNLVQPAFCAFFLSVLWSACAALTGSRGWGTGAMLLVGLGGHLEPLRQLATKQPRWPLDWWTTSRVIPNTINEYPAFTMLIGDAHAHFYALSLTALFIALCVSVMHAENHRKRLFTLAVTGILLGTVLLTNTWDAPLLTVLLFLCLSGAAPKWERWMEIGACIGIALAVSLPYFARFHSQVSGAKWDPWLPPGDAVLLLWGAWLAIAIAAFWISRRTGSPAATARQAAVSLGVAGTLALVIPAFFYLRGAFGDGDFRHMDTTFKFGLQAWLLLGTGASCEGAWRLAAWLKSAPVQFRWGTYYFLGLGALVLSLAPIGVLYARTTLMAPIGEPNYRLSLNAMRFLPENEQAAIRWLYRQRGPGTNLLTPTGNDYDAINGRFATFTGLPTILGWQGHVVPWGADYGEVRYRTNVINALYRAPSAEDVRRMANALPVGFLILPGPPEDGTSRDAAEAVAMGSRLGQVVWLGGTKERPEYPVVVRYGATERK